MRKELAEFTKQLEYTLSTHDKAKGDSWKTMPLMVLGDIFVEEFAECILHQGAKEYLDLANLCMMLWYRETHPSDSGGI